MTRIQLAKNFYLDEFTRSQLAERSGIDMRLREDSHVASNLRRLCRDILQPLRDALGPVHITSGWRPRELNRLLNSSDESAHIGGRAADLVVTGYTPLEVARWIKSHLPHYDQLIHEFGKWVHVAIAIPGGYPRMQALTSMITNDRHQRTRYVPGLKELELALEEVA